MTYMTSTDKVVITFAHDVSYNDNPSGDKVMLRIGNRVHLKSDDTLEMTIIDFEINDKGGCEAATVVWFDDYKQLHEATLPLRALIVKSDVMYWHDNKE